MKLAPRLQGDLRQELKEPCRRGLVRPGLMLAGSRGKSSKAWQKALQEETEAGTKGKKKTPHGSQDKWQMPNEKPNGDESKASCSVQAARREETSQGWVSVLLWRAATSRGSAQAGGRGFGSVSTNGHQKHPCQLVSIYYLGLLLCMNGQAETAA